MTYNINSSSIVGKAQGVQKLFTRENIKYPDGHEINSTFNVNLIEYLLYTWQNLYHNPYQP